jgi:hypothetical protein
MAAGPGGSHKDDGCDHPTLALLVWSSTQAVAMGLHTWILAATVTRSQRADGILSLLFLKIRDTS